MVVPTLSHLSTCTIHQTFYQVVYSDFIKMCQSQSKTSLNLIPLERKALDDLVNNKNIIIKSSAKGGEIVIQDKQTYILEAHRLLSDPNTYIKLTQDPFSTFSLEAASLANAAFSEGIISKTKLSFLKKRFYKTPYFYRLPKLHKA